MRIELTPQHIDAIDDALRMRASDCWQLARQLEEDNPALADAFRRIARQAESTINEIEQKKSPGA